MLSINDCGVLLPSYPNAVVKLKTHPRKYRVSNVVVTTIVLEERLLSQLSKPQTNHDALMICRSIDWCGVL